MIAGKSVLELVAVTGGALGFVTLLVAIQAGSRGRGRAEIIRAVGVLWAAAAGSLAAVIALKALLGGLFEVQFGGGTRLLWRSLTTGQVAVLAALIAVVIALYVLAFVAVRRLLAPARAIAVHPAGLPEDDAG